MVGDDGKEKWLRCEDQDGGPALDALRKHATLGFTPEQKGHWKSHSSRSNARICF